MRILGLDPSSTKTGYAVLERGAGTVRLIDAGCLKPERCKDDALTRTMAMRLSLVELLQEHEPDRAVVEVPSGKVGGGQRRGASASAMAIYGVAVGVMLATCLERLGSRVLTVDEREWTGRVPKGTRARRLAAEFAAYRAVMSKDGGGDIADAIGLARWGMSQPMAGS